MTPYPETIGEVLWRLLSIPRDNWGLFVAILVIIFSAVAIAAFIDNKTEKRIGKLRKVLSENLEYTELLQKTRANLENLKYMTTSALNSEDFPTKDARALKKMIQFSAVLRIGGFLKTIGIE